MYILTIIQQEVIHGIQLFNYRHLRLGLSIMQHSHPYMYYNEQLQHLSRQHEIITITYLEQILNHPKKLVSSLSRFFPLALGLQTNISIHGSLIMV